MQSDEGSPKLDQSARRIAVLEDDPVCAAIYRTALGRAGYECEIESTVASFMARWEHQEHHVQLLDWSLPDGTAADVIAWTRRHRGWQVPVIVASLHSEEEQVVEALALGADDYIFKPIRIQELLARIGAHLRKGNVANDDAHAFAPYKLQHADRSVTLDGVNVGVTPKEFDLLWCLYRNKGRLVSRQRLLEEVWNLVADVDTRTVDAHVSKLRRKLGLGPQSAWMIASGYGHGYRLKRREE